jgi:flagellin-like hook-associated protein FlgL
MTLKIGSNINSLKVQRRLHDSTRELNSTYQRLSSGQRINKAADDAAGLAISENLKVRGKVSGKALMNLNEGINLIGIADGAVSELTDIAVRVRELAAQGSNGGLSAAQRRAIDKEAQALSQEFTRIAQSTQHNNSKLFDGNYGDLRIQTGFGTTGSMGTQLGGRVGTGLFGAVTNSTTDKQDQLVLTDVNKDGIVDAIAGGSLDAGGGLTLSLGLGNGSFGAASTITSDLAAELETADVNGDGKTDLLVADPGNGLAIYLGNGSGGFSAPSFYTSTGDYYSLAVGDFNNDGKTDAALGSANGVIDIFAGNGNGTFTQKGAVSTGASTGLMAADLNNDGKLDLVSAENSGVGIYLGTGNIFGSNGGFAVGTYVGDFSAVELDLGDINADGRIDIAFVSADSAQLGILMGNGNGTFASQVSYGLAGAGTSVAIGEFDGNGRADVAVTVAGSSVVSKFMNQGNGTFGAETSVIFSKNISSIKVNDLNGDGVLDLAGTDNFNSVSVVLGQTTSGVASLVPFSLRSQEEAMQAVSHLDRAIARLTSQRGAIGALQSRYAMAGRVITAQREEGLAADSRIRDADYSTDVAKLVRAQIGQRTATAVLA